MLEAGVNDLFDPAEFRAPEIAHFIEPPVDGIKALVDTLKPLIHTFKARVDTVEAG